MKFRSKIPIVLLLIWLTVSLGAVLPTVSIKFGAPMLPEETKPVVAPPNQTATSNTSYFTYFLQAFVFGLIAFGVVGAFIYRKYITKDALASIISIFLAFLLFGAIYILANKVSISLYGGGSAPSNPHGSTPLYSQNMIILIAISAIMGILFGLFIVRVYKKKEVKVERKVITTQEAMERAIYKVKIGKDVRGAILAAYKEMEKLMKSRGVEDKKYYTPREFREFALQTLRISPKPVDTLTNLFEIARYSTHEMNEEHRRMALKALEDIRNESRK
jgi:uncharacterized protein YneF (UPF0154 family)